MFQVFVDSAANLPAVTAKKYDIHVVSFVNLVNGRKELVCFDPYCVTGKRSLQKEKNITMRCAPAVKSRPD